MVQMSLFAGRRSSDRAFLLLQNLFCAQHLPRYSGTSAVFAAVKLDALLHQSGMHSAEERARMVGKYLARIVR